MGTVTVTANGSSGTSGPCGCCVAPCVCPATGMASSYVISVSAGSLTAFGNVYAWLAQSVTLVLIGSCNFGLDTDVFSYTVNGGATETSDEMHLILSPSYAIYDSYPGCTPTVCQWVIYVIITSIGEAAPVFTARRGRHPNVGQTYNFNNCAGFIGTGTATVT